MAMEFTYEVSEIKVYDEGSSKDIVKQATLHIIGTQDGESYRSFMPIELKEPSGSFIEFDKLTKSQVETWVKETLGEDQLQANKDGLASIPGNPMFSKEPTRVNPVEKELLD